MAYIISLRYYVFSHIWLIEDKTEWYIILFQFPAPLNDGFCNAVPLHNALSRLLRLNSLVVRTTRCGRVYPGSNPGLDIFYNYHFVRGPLTVVHILVHIPRLNVRNFAVIHLLLLWFHVSICAFMHHEALRLRTFIDYCCPVHIFMHWVHDV